MRLRESYCSYCTVEKEDKRIIRIDENFYTCTQCGAQQMIVQSDVNSPYFYLSRLDRREEG